MSATLPVHAGLDVEALRRDFPILSRSVHGQPLVYLDNAATTQKPRAVIEAERDVYERYYANVHRGVHLLSVLSSDAYEAAREKVRAFVNAKETREVVFVRGTTEAINLVASSFSALRLGAGAEILITEMEHHSNIVPWQLLAQAVGAELRWLDVDDAGRLSLDQLDALLADGRVRMVAFAHVSNVLGTINPVGEIVARARAAGAATLIDGAQAVPQLPVDVRATGADFYAWTGHKAYGPTGVGVLHGRRELLEAMPPFLGGGSMIKLVTREGATWAEVPAKFEAGTPPIAEVVGLGAAVDVLAGLGMDQVRAHELDVTGYALERLAEIPGLVVHGPPAAGDRGALVSFSLAGVHPHDVSEIVGRDGVSIRAGHHCAQPLMRELGVGATSRASFAIHSTRADVDRLVDGLARVIEIFGEA